MHAHFDWRWFPLCLIGAMAVVFAINGYMVYTAVVSFPGTAGMDGFDLSNDYGKVLAAARTQAALGWQVASGINETGQPVLVVTDSTGARLTEAAIDARAERPLGLVQTTVLRFAPAGKGRFVADVGLPPGQWDLLLTIRAQSRLYTATQRLIVR